MIANVPYRLPKHITIRENGQPKRIAYGENDHCCARFVLAEDWLRAEALIRAGRVGNANAKLMRARDIVGVATARLADDPLIFLHPPEAGCAECNEARASV
ncbi:aminoglycoside N3'-acetyltransferase [Variibacter gotjawalensis]|nr:aminoglycoside N3'-acetyltransferase [Variibacter gotjawalensis]